MYELFHSFLDLHLHYTISALYIMFILFAIRQRSPNSPLFYVIGRCIKHSIQLTLNVISQSLTHVTVRVGDINLKKPVQF